MDRTDRVYQGISGYLRAARISQGSQGISGYPGYLWASEDILGQQGYLRQCRQF
jgi:hypothetical protein